MAKPTAQPTVRSAQHQALIDRERLVADARAAGGIEAQLEAIAADRAARWSALLAGREESADIRQWAADMATVHHRALVQVWRNRVAWITALYVVRYGEAEDFWPPQLTAEDVRRGRRWFLGDHPQGVCGISDRRAEP